VESINFANYIVNHPPTKDLKNIQMEEAWNKINLDVSHFPVFGNVAWAQILDEKMKYLHPKSEKCIFFGYSEDVKGYIILQPHSNEIIIKRDVEFYENLFSCKPNSTFVPSSACDPSLMFVPFSIPILVSSSSNDESEDENTPTPTHLPPNESIEHEHAPVPLLSRWVHSTREAVGDPLDHRRTCSQF
jgi:hypothetical protein